MSAKPLKSGPLSSQLKDKLLQQALERRLQRRLNTSIALSEPQKVNFDELSTPKHNIPEEFTRFDLHPGYQQIRIIRSSANRLGLANPFFNLHEGVASSHTQVEGRSLINFASYNYLNLSGDKRINDAAIDAMLRYGTSVSASRLVSGERPIHRDLEKAIADFYSAEDALVFVSGHATNVSTISQLFGAHDLILHDEYIHNSALQGIQLSGAKRIRFAHNDWQQLDQLLLQHRMSHERVLILVEGLYSMDGDYPDLPRFIEIRNRHKVFLMVDEAHSVGVMGPKGGGIREHFNLQSEDVDIWMGTLSKTLAGCGGYIAGESALVEQLRFLAPGFLYSVGMSPPLAAASLAALQCLEQEPWRVENLQRNGALFLSLAKNRGVDTGSSNGLGIVPAIIGSSIRATRLSEALLKRGINAQPILYPAVPEKTARLRFFMSSEHTEEDLRYSVDALAEEISQL